MSYTIPEELSVGTHNVTFSFDGSGDTDYNSSTRTYAALTKTKADTSLSLYMVTGSRGASVNLKTLLYSGGKPLSGKTVKFVVDGVVV